MEIAATLVGAIVTVAVDAAQSKLTTLINNRSCGDTEVADAEFINDEVGSIKAFIRDHCTAQGLSSVLQTESFAQLRRLAGDIEDCVDLFDAGKTEGFANKIRRLRTKSLETRDRIESYLLIAQRIVAGTPNGAVETSEEILRYLEIAQRLVGGTAQGADDVPGKLQKLLDKPSLRVWLDENLNRLLGTAKEVAVASQGAADELQVLLDDPRYQGWLAENLNCLLYLCLFPPNHHVTTEALVRRWMAEGLVKKEKDAAVNLRFIIDNSIIRSIKTSNNGEVETCQNTSQMHKCISKNSKSQYFVLVCDGATSITELAKARRLSVHPSPHDHPIWPKKLPRLRTLAVFPADKAGADNYEDVLDFSRYEVLRVLDLKEFAHLTDKHLDDIVVSQSQVLMKYLSLNLGSLKGISNKIEKLNQLETLDLSGTNILTVFPEVLFLPRLKHLLGKFMFSSFEIIQSHKRLREFLTNKSKLETLEGFVTGSRYGFQDVMSFMKRLRKVKIWCKSNASQAKLGLLSSAITEFIHRGTDAPHCGWSLSVDFAECSRGFVNEIVPVATGNLDSLELRGTLSQFPPFVSRLSAIEELCLCSTGLSWVVIREGLMSSGQVIQEGPMSSGEVIQEGPMISGEVIQKDPMSGGKGLKYLKLVEDNLGHIDIEPAHLRSIKRVCIVCKTTLDIAIQPGALPQLVSLRIHCQDLVAIPGTPGIEITHMEKLQEVALHLHVKKQIRSQWQHAVDGHTNRPLPVLLFVEGP